MEDTRLPVRLPCVETGCDINFLLLVALKAMQMRRSRRPTAPCGVSNARIYCPLQGKEAAQDLMTLRVCELGLSGSLPVSRHLWEIKRAALKALKALKASTSTYFTPFLDALRLRSTFLPRRPASKPLLAGLQGAMARFWRLLLLALGLSLGPCFTGPPPQPRVSRSFLASSSSSGGGGSVNAAGVNLAKNLVGSGILSLPAGIAAPSPLS